MLTGYTAAYEITGNLKVIFKKSASSDRLSNTQRYLS